MGRLVPAVTRALDVLELFLQGDGTLSAPEVTRRLRLPRTTVHELLTTLAARSYLVKDPDRPGQYRLGVRTYQLGSRYAEQLDLAAEGRQVARRLAADCGESVHVAILDGTDTVCVAQAESTHAVRLVSVAGHRLPAHCTAAGKALLASLPAPELDARLGGPALTALTPHTITGAAELRAALDAVREQGFAVEHQESGPGVGCVAAPVHDRSGQVVAALSVAVPLIRWNEERARELAALAGRGAGELSRRLGHERSPV